MPKIITAHTGTPHISADDVGALLKAVLGSNDYLLSDNPETFTAALLDNNTVQLSEAEVVLQGTHIRIQATDKVTIEQGQSGMKRIDFVVCRYSKDDSGIENAEIAVVKGIPAVLPSVPTITQGDIRDGTTLHEMPLFKVELEDFAVTKITNICKNLCSADTLMQTLILLLNSLSDIEKAVDDNTAKINDISSYKLLWSGVNHMTKEESITNLNIKNQTNGIVLIFQAYENKAIQNWGFHSFFVPKGIVSRKAGCGHNFLLVSGVFENFACKYLYISDNKISGHEDNNKSGTSTSGIKYNNAKFVLSYVFGV